MQDLAKRYIGLNENGKLNDIDLRQRLANHLMDRQAHALTLSRIAAEAKGKVEVSAAASILKNSATHVSQTRADLTLEIMGDQGLGWEGDTFDANELETVRSWLYGMAASIAGGSFEIQYNIISKNILGLPETTQQG
jgi:alkylation response protein AidB-like acyl-CoA dehydrogenase